MTAGRSLSFAGLLDEIAAVTRQFVVMTEAQVVAVTLWIAHTHAIEAVDVTPYLHVTAATKRAGKTRLLEVLDLLVARPWMTGRVSAAVLPRKIDREQPTLLLDESDAAFGAESDYSEALRGILNSGYRRSGKSSLCVGQGAKIGYQDFATFCAKAIAGIGNLPDTIADRSIPIVLRRRTKAEPVKRFRRRTVDVLAAPLRERLQAWAEGPHGLHAAEPVVPTNLNDRAAEVWEALLAIAELASTTWSARATRAAIELSGEAQEAEPVVELLQDIGEILASYAFDFLPSAYIIEDLNARDDRPWNTWRRGEKPLTTRGLAAILGPLGIYPSQGINPTSQSQARGYRRDAFCDAFARYPAPQSSTRQTPNAGWAEPTANIRHDEAKARGGRKSADEPGTGCFDDLTVDTDGDPSASPLACGGCNLADCEWCDGPNRDR